MNGNNRNQPPRGRFIGPMNGNQSPSMQQQRPAPYRAQLPPARPMLPPEAMGDPGYGFAGGVSGADVRRALEGFERKMQDQLDSLRGDTDARFNEVFQMKAPGFGLQGMSQSELQGLGEDVRRAISGGRCFPYSLVTIASFAAGTFSERVPAGLVLTTDGPMFICKMLAYAQIDDVRAENFPFSLIDAPPCDAGITCLTGNPAITFDINCKTLIPTINANGMFIPISPQHCKLICCGTEVCCGTQTCDTGDGTVSTTNFSTRVPITILDHPECVDGITEIVLNGCQWQNIGQPLATFEDANFDICNDSPDCVGVCGFLDCQKELDFFTTLTRPLRFDINIFYVLMGFRILTCGPGSCAAP